MTTQLDLYNAALLEIGERRLTSLTEDTRARHTLDDVYRSGELVRFFLEQGLWNFAMRTVEVTYSPSIEPPFGYEYAFDKPLDWIRTAGVWQDEQMTVPLEQYEDEREYWFASNETIWVQYISDDDAYGGDLSLWPPTFTRWTELYLASRISEDLTQNATKTEMLQKMADPAYPGKTTALVSARSKDAMNEPTRRLHMGEWARSRYQRGSDDGSRPGL